MRIWKRLNLCKTFWSGERSCLIVARYLSCQTFDYVVTKWNIFHITFLKSVSRFLFCLDENIFTLTFWDDEKKNILWKIFLLFAEMLNEITVNNTLQLVWIVCRDDKWYKHYYTLCNCHTLWLIVNKIRNLYINFRGCLRGQTAYLTTCLQSLFLT